jgi:hypothetical protein
MLNSPAGKEVIAMIPLDVCIAANSRGIQKSFLLDNAIFSIWTFLKL